MWTPEADVQHVVVRVEAGIVLYGFFARHTDGALAIVPASRERPDTLNISRSNAGEEWPLVLRDLSGWGFVGLAEAQRRGIVSPNWAIPAGADDVGAVAEATV